MQFYKISLPAGCKIIGLNLEINHICHTVLNFKLPTYYLLFDYMLKNSWAYINVSYRNNRNRKRNIN